jgi:hypothetical protein
VARTMALRSENPVRKIFTNMCIHMNMSMMEKNIAMLTHTNILMKEVMTTITTIMMKIMDIIIMIILKTGR